MSLDVIVPAIFLHNTECIVEYKSTLDRTISEDTTTIKNRRKALSETDRFPPASLFFIITKSFPSDYKENGFSVL